MSFKAQNWIQGIFYSTEEVVKYIVHGTYCNLSYYISLRTDLEFRLHCSLKTWRERERERERERDRTGKGNLL